ncbi:uncharacterized protein LOC110975188 [Acanthaster planci]|uniref:Uncharacterized protein LOC110975188 n=1 Tax=Acanthaster planci TaxID=133434 RepID=A0A8B7XQK5_ACAPL|nr:uncharacterized protein LOC110975188 [Acanthaster planci]
MGMDVAGDDEVQQSWWKRQQTNFRKEVNDFDLAECSGCRYIGGGGMIGAGLYVAYAGYRRAKGLGRKWRFIPSTLVGSALVTLGLMRLSGHNPFSSSGKSVGIDALEPLKDMISKSQTEAELRKKLQKLEQQRLDNANHMEKKLQGVEHMGKQEKPDTRQQKQDSSAPGTQDKTQPS